MVRVRRNFPCRTFCVCVIYYCIFSYHMKYWTSRLHGCDLFDIYATRVQEYSFSLIIIYYPAIVSLGQVVDTVVMNPPFGTRRKGADMDFLSVSLKVMWGMIYLEQEPFIFTFVILL